MTPLLRRSLAILLSALNASPALAQTVTGSAAAAGSVSGVLAASVGSVPTVVAPVVDVNAAVSIAPSVAPALVAPLAAPAALPSVLPSAALASPIAAAPAALPTLAAPASAAPAAAKPAALQSLRGAAPEIAGKNGELALERFYTGGARAPESADGVVGRYAVERGFSGLRASDPAEPAGSSGSPARKLSFEEFGRAGEQSFFGGRLKDGQHGGVVAVDAPARARPEGALPDDGEMRRRMELPTLTNPQREEKGIELYQLGGAAKEVVTLGPKQAPMLDRFHTVMRQDAGRGRHNLIVVKPGRDPNKIVVVGAHHDKVNVGEGKIDNWGGAVMMANLYQAMRDIDTESTYVFVMFSREEEGLLGSQFFVNSLPKETRPKIKAMINVDTVGVNTTGGWQNNSSKYLLELAAQVAKAKGLDYRPIVLHGGDSDSSSFKRFTHAMTIMGATPDVIWDILHSENDNMGAFSLPHYVNTTKLVFELLQSLDRATPPAVQEEPPQRRWPWFDWIASAWRSRFGPVAAVGFLPRQSIQIPVRYYHGTSWADLMAAVENGGSLKAGISYFASAPAHSEPYATARARKKRAAAVLLEFDASIGSRLGTSYPVLGQYPANQAVRDVPLASMTADSKAAVLAHFEQAAASLHPLRAEMLYRRLQKALGVI